MSELLVSKIMTENGPASIDYNALANLPVIDDTLSATSTNAVQNAAVTNVLNSLSPGIGSLSSEIENVKTSISDLQTEIEETKLDKDATAVDSEKLGGMAPEDCAITVYTHTKSGNVHNFVGSGSNGKALITADFADGDVFCVNDVEVPAYCGQDVADSDTIVNGRWVTFIYDGKQINFRSGGGLGLTKLALATATPEHVLVGETFYSSGTKELQTGAIPIKEEEIYRADTIDQIISAKQYLNGEQTIAAVTQSNLNAENILDGVTVSIKSRDTDIWSVTGTVIPNTSTLIGYSICNGWGYGDTVPKWIAVNGSLVGGNSESLIIMESGTYTIIATIHHNDGITSYIKVNDEKLPTTSSGLSAIGYLKDLNATDVFTGLVPSSNGDGNGSNAMTCFIFKGDILKLNSTEEVN